MFSLLLLVIKSASGTCEHAIILYCAKSVLSVLDQAPVKVGHAATRRIQKEGKTESSPGLELAKLPPDHATCASTMRTKCNHSRGNLGAVQS